MVCYFGHVWSTAEYLRLLATTFSSPPGLLFPIESSKLWDGTIRYTPQPFKGLSIERPATHPDSSSSPKQDMPSPRSGVDWPKLTPHSAGTISPRFSPQSLDLGIFCLGSVLPLRCAAFMGPSMSARRPPADKAVMLIGQQRCINGDRPITTDTAAAPEWWLLIASTAAETTTSCTLAARHPLRTWLLGCWISPSRPLEPPKTALIPARQSSPRHRVVCSDERTQLRLDKEKKPRWREEASGVVSQHLGLPNIGRGTPPLELEYGPRYLFCSRYRATTGHFPLLLSSTSSRSPRIGCVGGFWACLMQPTLRHRSPMQAGAINVMDGAIDKRGLRPTSSPTTGQENSRT